MVAGVEGPSVLVLEAGPECLSSRDSAYLIQRLGGDSALSTAMT